MQLVRYIPMAKTNNTPLVRKTAPFYGQVVSIIHSEACPEDKPVRASSRTYSERILGAYFERMAGCLSGNMSMNQYREEPFETKTDVRSPIVKAPDFIVRCLPRFRLTYYP